MRGSWLTEQELWAVCRECCLTLKRISNSTDVVQSLCVMLETLAFDSHGNVCFNDHDCGECSSAIYLTRYRCIYEDCLELRCGTKIYTG